MVGVRRLSEELLAEGHTVRIHARGRSMYPVIAGGDSVTVRLPLDLAPGDLVVYKRHGELVCHRLVSLTGGADPVPQCLTWGDALLEPDRPVPVDRIVGKVVTIERGRVSPSRRLLLLAQPVLKAGRLNAAVVSLLSGLWALLAR